MPSWETCYKLHVWSLVELLSLCPRYMLSSTPEFILTLARQDKCSESAIPLTLPISSGLNGVSRNVSPVSKRTKVERTERHKKYPTC